MSEPVEIISCGGGVQSSTVALMAALGEIEPMPVAAVFADTQAEPKSVYLWLDWLERQLPFPLYRVTAGNLAVKALKTSGGITALPLFTILNGRMGNVGMRSCTRDFKIVPITKACRRIAGIKKGQKTTGVIQWIGISTDEASRMKDSREPWQKNRWPLIEKGMSRSDCLKWMESHGFPKPPRSACVFCPYHSQTEWRRLRDEEPEDFQKAVEFDAAIRKSKALIKGFDSIPFIHNSRKPLSEVDFRTEEERGQFNLFNNECEGMCGV